LAYHHHLKTYLAIAGTILFWGLSFVATKVALESIPPVALIFIRFSGAASLLVLLMSRQKLSVFTAREHVKMLLLAIFHPGLYFIFETVGLKFTTAPKTALILATTPLTVLILSRVFLKERTGIKAVMGIFLSIAGIAVLIFGDPKFVWGLDGHLMGDLFIFGAVITAALYTILSRHLGQNHSALKITAWQFMYGTIFYLPIFLWQFQDVQWSAISMPSWGALIYLTVLATVGAFLCYNYALSQMPASRVAVSINGIPVITAVGAWLILGETLTLVQAGGGLLVMIAVGLANLPSNYRVR
jgi:drug/metabolite transporter (DMT)-like permease